ncbi:hypothetical protein PFISCL1PPCAC_856, partial [Pristionchus fissidentatus]
QQLTTDDFTRRLRTLEGNIAFQLGTKLTQEVDIDDRLALMRPRGEPIRIGEFAGSYRQNFYGTANPNLENKTMTNICQHVHCDTDTERVPPRCIDTFTPKGHCCPVCGSMFEVQTYRKTLNDLEMILAQFRRTFQITYKIQLSDVYHYSIERLDDSDYEFRYQVLFVVRDNDTVLDEDTLKATTMLFLSSIGNYWHPSAEFQLIEMKESSRDHSFAMSSIVLGTFFFLISAITATFYFSVEARNQARFLYRRSRLYIDSLRVQTTPAEVEMSGGLIEGENKKGLKRLQDLSSECESGN